MTKNWVVYIVECADGSLYTGISNDVEKRIAAHNAGKGAKYTKGRGPVVLRFSEKVKNKSEALKREAEIKRMMRQGKEKLFDV